MRWKDLPDEYPSPATCWRRLSQWEEDGVWLRLWRAFLSELDDRGQLDWSEAFMDGTLMAAKKGDLASERHAKVRGQSAWYWSTARVFLSECRFSAANEAEPRLAIKTLNASIVPRKRSMAKARRPARIIADRAYDSRRLWEQMSTCGVDLIVPHKCNRTDIYQDGRKLRRYKKRWIVERTFAGLFSFRRLFVRHERESRLFKAMTHIACALIVLRRF